MLNTLTKIAMLASFVVFSGFAATDWLGQLLGWHDEVRHLLELPDSATMLPSYLVILGSAVAFAGIAGLAVSFVAIWRILSDGQTQDFRRLAARLQRMAYGFIAFWFSNYVLFSFVRTLLLWSIAPLDEAEILWNPLGPDLIFAITSVALLAISKQLERAWQAEEENRHFL